MRDQSEELLPFFVHIDDRSVLPLQTLSSGPPAHLVPADLTPAMDFQPELHCHIGSPESSPVRSHDRQATYAPAARLRDPDVGVGLTALTLTVDYPDLVHQPSPTSSSISSPLVPRKCRGERS